MSNKLQPRFSRTTLALYLWQRIKYLQEKHNFSTNNGHAQVSGMATATQTAYGDWMGCKLTMDRFDLWDLIPADQFTGFGVVGRGKVRDA